MILDSYRSPWLTEDAEALLEQYSQHLMNVFGPPQAVLARGEGSVVWDADGNRLLDLLGGIALAHVDRNSAHRLGQFQAVIVRIDHEDLRGTADFG